jgi:hydrogenase nickel incorporation protein HypA/HybF
MHEASAAASILRIALEEASRRGATRVTRLRVVAGEATGYMEESLAFFLGVLSKGGAAEGAALELSCVKTRLRCRSCGAEFDRRGSSFACPSCGGPGELTGAGDEFYLDSIEIEGGSEWASTSS